jgi:hypothetical protein
MLIRDINGKINIISRSSCDTESAYNEKIYQIYLGYTRMYKSTFEYNLFEYTKVNNNINVPASIKINNLDEDNDDEY